MSQVSLTLDTKGFPIQALRLSNTAGDSFSTAIGASSTRTALPASTEVVRICATVACHFAFGNSSVAATGSDPMLGAGAYDYITIPPGATHVAVIQEGAVTGNFITTRCI